MSSTRSSMGTSSNTAGNTTRSELEDSMDPLHAVAVVAGDLRAMSDSFAGTEAAA
jgi:hypothetical protein